MRKSWSPHWRRDSTETASGKPGAVHFTDRHAYLKAAQFSNELSDLSWIIWKSLQARDFKRDDVDKFEKYQAEALIHRHMPIASLLGIVCYSESVAAMVRTLAERQKADVKIVAEPKWYL